MALTPEEEAELAELEAGEQAPKSGGLMRQVGLTARAATPQAIGAGIGAAMGAPIGGVGAIPGAGAGLLAMTILEAVDSMGGTDYIGKALDKLGLPRPASPEERVAETTMKGMVGASGLGAGAKALATNARMPIKQFLEQLAANPKMGLLSGAAGGAAGGATAEAGGGSLEQMAASTVASLAAPGAAGLTRKIGNTFQQTGDVIGAAAGAPGSLERLVGGVARERAGADLPFIEQALQRSRTLVPGARPTVGEIIAGANIGKPQQRGGALVRLQDDLTGARGVEDVLPSAARRSDVAIQEFVKNLEAQLAPQRAQALQAANPPTGGIDPRNLSSRIKWSYVQRPGHSSLVDKVVPQILKRIEKKTALGVIHPDDVYALRKDLKGMIDEQMKSGKWSKTDAAKVEIGIKRMLDDAIEQAGGTGWKAYLKRYERGLRRVDQYEARRAEMKGMLKNVQSQEVGKMAQEHAVQPPTLLHRPMMLLNFALRQLGADANEKLVKEMATRLQDPRQFAQLLRMPPQAPARQTAAEVLSRAGVVAGLIARHQEDEGLDEPVQ